MAELPNLSFIETPAGGTFSLVAALVSIGAYQEFIQHEPYAFGALTVIGGVLGLWWYGSSIINNRNTNGKN